MSKRKTLLKTKRFGTKDVSFPGRRVAAASEHSPD
jgi:hypothetical protein